MAPVRMVGYISKGKKRLASEYRSIITVKHDVKADVEVKAKTESGSQVETFPKGKIIPKGSIIPANENYTNWLTLTAIMKG